MERSSANSSTGATGRDQMTSLKKAKKEGKFADFIKEHEGDVPSEKEQFNKVLGRMTKRKRSEAPEVSALCTDDD